LPNDFLRSFSSRRAARFSEATQSSQIRTALRSFAPKNSLTVENDRESLNAVDVVKIFLSKFI
jgi:hypothetical protein